MGMWRFAGLMEPVSPEHRVTLGEGDTPLVRSQRIGPAAGLKRLFFKLEGSNPTGSYKDRFASVAVSSMLASGKSRCVATSSGNGGAALAAYCARAAIACEIVIIETAVPGKLSQMLAYGASLKRVRGFGVDPEITRKVFDRLRELDGGFDAALQITAYHFSPIGMTGVQSISYELQEQAHEQGLALDHVFVPAGGGGLALAVARGFELLCAADLEQRSPAVNVVQPEGNDTIATPLREGRSHARAIQCTSAISGLQVPSVIDGDDLIAASRASKGRGYTVSDEQVWQLQSRLAREEGVFCEPAAAVSLAGALQAAERGEIASDAMIVCLVTGSGFKDSASVERMTRDSTCPLIEFDDL